MKKITINGIYHNVYKKTLEVLSKNDFYVKESSEGQKYITANKKGSFFSYGETIEITFEKTTANSTKVSINSYSKGLQLIDWNTNNENEELIGKELKRLF